MSVKKQKTIVGAVDPAVLAYTAGEDIRLDRALVEVDCLGSAAHARMLAEMPLKLRELREVLKTLFDLKAQPKA